MDGKAFTLQASKITTNSEELPKLPQKGVAFFDPLRKTVTKEDPALVDTTQDEKEYSQALHNNAESEAYMYCTALFVWWQTGTHPFLEREQITQDILIDFQYLIVRYNQVRQMHFWENWGKILGGSKKKGKR